MADTRLDLIIKARDEASAKLKTINKALDDMGVNTKKQSSVFNDLGRAIVAAVSVAAVIQATKSFVSYGATVQDLNNKLIQVAGSQGLANEYFTRLVDVANSSRSSLDSTASTFQRFEMTNKQLGVSTEETFKMVETLNKGLAASGASASEASSATLQLAQAYASGRLQGDEFRSLSEAFPTFMFAMADSMGVTIGELKKMGSEGKLTSDIIRTTLSEMGATVDEQFKTMPVTIGQAFVMMNNQVVSAMKQINDQTGIFDEIAKSILTFAEAVNAMTPILVEFIVQAKSSWETLASFFSTDLLPQIEAIGMWFNDVYNAVLPIIENMVSFIQEQFSLLVASTGITTEDMQSFWVTLGDFFNGVVMPIIKAFVDFTMFTFELLKPFIQVLTETIGGLFGGMFQIIQGLMEVFVGLFTGDWERLKEGLFGIANGIWKTLTTIFNYLWKSLVAIGQSILTGLTGIWNLLSNGTIAVFNAIVSGAGDIWNGFIGVVVTVGEGIKNAFIAIWDAIKQIAIDTARNAIQWGKDIIAGLISGIQAMAGQAIQMVANIGDQIGSTFKNALGIRSPSKVFAGYGKNIVQGLVSGLDGSSGAVDSAMNRLSANVSGFDASPSISASVSSGARILPQSSVKSGVTIINQISTMIGDEAYAEKMGDMIVKNLALNTSF